MKKAITLLAIATLIAACNAGGNKNNPADERMAKNKAGMQRFLDEVFNKHNPPFFDSCVTADFIDHQLPPGYPPDREGTKKFFKDFFAAYPDINRKANWMVADTSYVVTFYTLTGTNSGAFMGMPATGKKMNINGVDIVRFVNGKGAEHWGYDEQIKMMMQLGKMPGMNQSDSSKTKM